MLVVADPKHAAVGPVLDGQIEARHLRLISLLILQAELLEQCDGEGRIAGCADIKLA